MHTLSPLKHVLPLVKQLENSRQSIHCRIHLAAASHQHEQSIDREVCLILLKETLVVEFNFKQAHKFFQRQQGLVEVLQYEALSVLLLEGLAALIGFHLTNHRYVVLQLHVRVDFAFDLPVFLHVSSLRQL